MSIQERFGNIANAAWQGTDSAFEFLTDILQEFTGSQDEYDGMVGTIWGSWNDNVIGEGGVLQSAIGPEGVGGEIIDALPNPVKDVGRPIFNATFDTIDVAYEMVFDRPLAVLFTLANAGVMDGTITNYIDPRVWQQAAEIASLGDVFDSDTWTGDSGGSRSAGQAFALMINRANILDPTEVERIEGTPLYNISSGIVDAALQWYLDPANLAGKAIKAKRSTKNQELRDQVVEGNYEAVLNTNGYRNFKGALKNIVDESEVPFSDKFNKGEGFVFDDEVKIGELATKILGAAKRGQFGRPFRNMTWDEAQTYASLSGGLDVGRMDQAFDYMIRIQLGDVQAIADMEKAAKTWVSTMLNSNIYDELMAVQDELAWLNEMETKNLIDEPLAEAATLELPPQFERLAKKLDLSPEEIFERRQEIIEQFKITQRDLEATLFNDSYGNMPFAAALILKQERFRTLAHNVSNKINGVEAHKGLEWFDDGVNNNPDLVSAAADEILLKHNINLLEPLPMIGDVAKNGIAVKTFIMDSPIGKGVAANPAVRLVTEKVPHQLMNWDDPAQQFTTFERMLRDAGNVVFEGKTLLDEAGLNSDRVLGEFMQIKSQKARRQFFEAQVTKLNASLPTLFNKTLDQQSLDNMARTLQRQYGRAQEVLQTHAKASKAYGNLDYSRLDYATDGEIMARYIPMTPAQLRESSLVPRYDLYQQAFGDNMSSASRKIRGTIEQTLNNFTAIWKKAVLLRPAWPMRVLIDEVARNAATIGAQATLSGFASGFNDLRVAWFRKSGVDIGRPMMDEIIFTLNQAKIETRKMAKKGQVFDENSILGERWNDWSAEKQWDLKQDDYVELLQSYNEAQRLGLVDPITDLTKRVISKEYGKQRITRRTAMTTGLGLFLAGPIGAAVGGLYSLYGQNTMRRVARSEVLTNQLFALREGARADLAKIKEGYRQQVAALDPNDLETAKKLTKEMQDLDTAAKILERGAKEIEQHDQWLLDNFKKQDSKLYDNFQRVGELASEGNYNNIYLGGYSVENAFGDNPTEIAIYKNAISSDNSNRQMWEGVSVAARRTTRQRDRTQYDIKNPQQTDSFPAAYNDTLNRQWIPIGGKQTPFQEFMSMFWDGSSDETILKFLQNEGQIVRESFPDFFNQDPIALISDLRAETNTYIPDLPEFENVRKNAANGTEIEWNRDIQPIIDRSFDGEVDKVRKAAQTDDFGKIVGDSSLQDAARHRNLQMRVNNWVEEAFENIGTMTTDSLTRSPLFRALYEKEIARQLAPLENPDNRLFTLSGKDIEVIENRARSKAIIASKELLYDLAERSRFEEVASNLMPFVGAWQEVATRWTGIAIDNPHMVARVVRNWRLLEAEDEDGNPLAIFRLPNIFDTNIPGDGEKFFPFSGGKWFGKASVLTDTAVNFNIKSISMIGGTPGVGPLVSYPISEIVIENPSFESAVGWVLPYGVNEGQNALTRWFDSASPVWMKAMAGATGLSTPERAQTLARVTADLAYEYESNGDIISTESDWQVFEDEVYRRTTQILQIRAFGATSMPMSFRMQSPHWKMIDKYYEISKENGIEAADTWLLHNHSDLWAITGRQTAARGVASGTLQGDKAYDKHQEFADTFPELRDLIIGRVGPLDVKFEYSRAVKIGEMQDGRRADLTPREIYEGASTTKGWKTWRGVMDFVNEQLEASAAMGQSGDLQAHPKLLDLVNSTAVVMGRSNPTWYEEKLQTESPLGQARVIQGLREFLLDPTFNYHPSWALIERWVDNHDDTSLIMQQRYESTGNRDFLRLSYEGNADIAADFHTTNLDLALRPDLAEIHTRFLSSIDTVKQTNFAWNFPTTNKALAA